MKKVFIIGQAPGKNAISNRAWEGGGATAKRLFRWFGVRNRKELIKFADTINIIPYYMGKNGKGDRIPTDKKVIFSLREKVIKRIIRKKYDKIIFVGKFSQKLIESHLNFLDWDVESLSIPHPSGINIAANGKDIEVKEKIKCFLRGVLYER